MGPRPNAADYGTLKPTKQQLYTVGEDLLVYSTQIVYILCRFSSRSVDPFEERKKVFHHLNICAYRESDSDPGQPSTDINQTIYRQR